MIIQCEQCQTKFKLDDSKVTGKSIKVRCARCRHVFTVAGTQSVPKDVASFEQQAPVFQVEEDLMSTASTEQSASSFEPVSHLSVNKDHDFALSTVDSAATHGQEEIRQDSNAIDFSAFDFSDESVDVAKPAGTSHVMDFEDTPEEQRPDSASSKEKFGGLDFSGDDVFGQAVSQHPEETVSHSISHDLEMDAFAESMGIKNKTTDHSTSVVTKEPIAESPTSIEEIDFGDELTSVAVQQITPEELKQDQDLLFAPVAPAETKPILDNAVKASEKTAEPAVQEELPPLPITSRRKEGPRIGFILVILGIVIAGLAALYSYWGNLTTPENKGKAAQETGRIIVRSVEASFVKNQQVGDLLVISGEAVNGYNKARAAIQVKGIVFGPDGKMVSSKSVFCGNPLSREQLATLTMDKIETAMANQFGDSLVNMEVAPGAVIPFVIVLPKPPAGASDYGVEPAGSTVAAGKEK